MSIIRRIKLCALPFLVILAFTTCNKDEVTPREYPRVKTLDVNEITESGARFNAEITYPGNGEITEYGFVWGEEEKPTVENSEKKILEKEITAGGFSSKITTTLKEGFTYNVRAYVKNDKYLVYGKVVSFLSLGSSAPLLGDFQPKYGIGGDTVSLIGKNFSFRNSTNKVFFNSYESKILNSTDTLIQCIVPENIPDRTAEIQIQVAGQKYMSNEEFVLIAPEISAFAPVQGTFGDKVTILGSNFSLKSTNNIVRFNGVQAQVIESSKSSLKVIVPTGIRSRLNHISVSVDSRTDTTSASFTINPPKIFNVSPQEQFIKSYVTIEGDNFNPDANGNQVYLDNIQGIVIDASKSKLVVEIPDSIYTHRSFPVEVVTAEQSNLSIDSVTIKNAWLRKANAPKDTRYGSVTFSVQNMGYAGLKGNHKLWKYNPNTNLWSRVTDFPGGPRYYAFSFVLNGNAYVGGGYYNSVAYDDLWKYDPQRDTWSYVNTLPIKVASAVGLSVNGKGYICKTNYSNNFWEYDPDTNNWTQLPDLETISAGAKGIADAGFSIGNKIYIYASGNSTGLHQLYEYDVLNRSWAQKADMISFGIRTDITGQAVSGKGYILGYYYVHEYDPELDKWVVRDDFFNYNQYSGRSGVSFELDGRIFFRPGTDYDEFWEFNPLY